MNETIYISGYLPELEYATSVASDLIENISKRGYTISKINNHSKNEWCRDYMPVKNSEDNLVQFKYAPAYMTDTRKWIERIPNSNAIHKELNLSCIDASDIILDGGAIEIYGTMGIISDRIFRDNPMNEIELIYKLRAYLQLDRLIIIPQHPYDFTGHVDGLIRFIDKNTVLINDMQEELSEARKSVKKDYRSKLIVNWYHAFMSTIYNADLEFEILPSCYTINENDSDGNGIYLNFLNLSEDIVMPAYKDKSKNEEAEQKLKKIYSKNVISIDATELAKKGGMINCVTWTK